MKLAIIGLGKWGTNIKKTLESLGIDLTSPGGLRGAEADGVIVATPGSTHAEVALPFIKQGLPVFIEKPMTTSLKDAKKLAAAAKKSGSLVFVGHLHLYNPAFLKAKELIKKAGKIRYVSFEGMNWGPFRDDMSAWWDWAPHDISMALDLFGQPKSIQAWGDYTWTVARLHYGATSPVSVGEADSPGVGAGFSVLIHVTTLSSQKRKRLAVAGTKYSVVFDDTSERKLELYKKGQVSYPEYNKTPPLTVELKAFIQMIKTKKIPKTDIQNGFDVVKILDAGEKSMRLDGRQVILKN